MTGPEHYREAERVILHIMSQEEVPVEALAAYATAAQVHATLALAAATALAREGADRTQPSLDRAAWFNAAAEPRKADPS